MLDEPTNGLDPEGIQEVRALLRSLANEGTSVFVSSHLLSELELISDYLVMLRKGQVVFTGKMTDLMLNQQPVIIAKGANETELVTLLAIAEAAGHHAIIRDGAVHVEGPASWALDFNRAAFDAGITLSQLTPQLPNLEETFFEMTGEK
jgi:ABC-2 type transport system ATP-binding protein